MTRINLYSTTLCVGRSTVTPNWDMNFKDICATPTKVEQLPYQGKELTKQQLWAYESQLRGQIWEQTAHYTEAAKNS